MSMASSSSGHSTEVRWKNVRPVTGRYITRAGVGPVPSAPRGAKPEGQAVPDRKKMPSPAFIRSLGRHPDRFGAS